MTEYNFDPIRPYYEDEIPAALKRIVEDPQFDNLLEYLFPDEQHHEVKSNILSSESRYDFQRKFMLPVIRAILGKTAGEITDSGMENVLKDSGHVFIANHRDIILDSYILAQQLFEHGHDTCRITWGDNLMVSPFVVDLGKVNRMVTVFREGSPKEMLRNSQMLSAYIRQTVTEENQTVWIAQRKGRSKDGTDTTDVGVLKMLCLLGRKDIIKSLKELQIIPVSISYEWEPCDTMKVRELLMSAGNTYVKDENEDLRSIIGGVVSEKGRIHVHTGKPLKDELDSIDSSLRPNEIIQQVASLIDRHIHSNYKLWPSNYYAYDLLNNNDKFKEHYDEAIRKKFNERLQNALDTIKSDDEVVKNLFLKLYANPVYNQLT